MELCDSFLTWAKKNFNPKNRPKFRLTKRSVLEAIIIDRDGNIITYDETLVPNYLGKQEMYAMGTGANLAYGAMLFGANAKEAVIVASQMDIYTGGHVKSIRFNKRQKSE